MEISPEVAKRNPASGRAERTTAVVRAGPGAVAAVRLRSGACVFRDAGPGGRGDA